MGAAASDGRDGADRAAATSSEHTVGREAMRRASAASMRVRAVDGAAAMPLEDAALAEALRRATRDDGRGRPLDDAFLRPVARAPAPEEPAAAAALARALPAGARADGGAPARGRDGEGGARAGATSAPATGASTSDACVGCGGALGALERVTSVRALGGCWHARCFRCDDCGEQLRGVFGGGGEYVVTGKPGEDRRLFHARCYRERHRPTCCVCAACIPSRDGYIHFETTPYWGEISCVEHATDGTNRCDGCRRYEKRGGEEYIAAPDGRTLCLECVQTVVIDTKDAEPLYRDILDFFGTYGLSALGTGGELPPLYLCTQDVINHVDEEEKWHQGRTSQVRGMCVSHVETISTVYRQPTWKPSNAGSVFDVFGQLDMVEHRIPRSTTQKVTAIIVLSCLPRVLFSSILAHECMHMYLRLNGFPTLEPIVEEGLCQLFALLWIERQMASQNATASDAALAAYCCEAIREDPSEIYGVGARLAIDAYDAHGLVRVLDSVRRTRNFPISS